MPHKRSTERQEQREADDRERRIVDTLVALLRNRLFQEHNVVTEWNRSEARAFLIAARDRRCTPVDHAQLRVDGASNPVAGPAVVAGTRCRYTLAPFDPTPTYCSRLCIPADSNGLDYGSKGKQPGPYHGS